MENIDGLEKRIEEYSHSLREKMNLRLWMEYGCLNLSHQNVLWVESIEVEVLLLNKKLCSHQEVNTKEK